jgi:hypothetical protein
MKVLGGEAVVALAIEPLDAASAGTRFADARPSRRS